MNMVAFIPEAQLQENEAARVQALRDAEEKQNQSHITSLASYVMNAWEACKQSKIPIEEKMLEGLQRKNGEYSATKLSEIQKVGGSAIFMMLTDEKCSAVSSWLNDILFPAEDKPWSISPTPVPELNPVQIDNIKQDAMDEVNQEITEELTMMVAAGELKTRDQAASFVQDRMRERAEEMANDLRSDMEKAAKEARDKVEDNLYDEIIESGWAEAVEDSIEDIATFPAGIVKGPVLRKKKVLKWRDDVQLYQNTNPLDLGFAGWNPTDAPVEVVEEIKIDFNRVSPFDVYPFPNAKAPKDGIIERHKLTISYLNSLIGVEGYDDDAIRLALTHYGHGNSWLSVSVDHQREILENRPHEERSPEPTIDALQMWAPIQGVKLLAHGISPDLIDDPLKSYSAEVWLIGRYIIKAELNGDPMGDVPYNFASFRKRNGSIWGAGVPEIIKDCQDAANASARNLINNMGISSGVQVGVDVSQFDPSETITSIRPMKIWKYTSKMAMGGAANRPPISFFTPPSHSDKLISVYKFFSEEADDKTGVPKYTYGASTGGGALSTSSGLSMMMNNAARGIKNVVKNIDKGIIKPTIERTHRFKLFYFRDPAYYVGDVKIIAKGSIALVAKETAALRRNEFLQIATKSDAIQKIIKLPGLGSMLKEIMKSADFKDTEIVPSRKELEKQEKQEMLALQQQMMLEAQANGEGNEDPYLNQEVDAGGAVQGGAEAQLV